MMRYNIAIILSGSLALTACGGMLERLDRVGQEPPIAETDNPIERPEYKPMTWPTPERVVDKQSAKNSLWQPGARAFFRDQRAHRVGDILTVKVDINDSATLDSTTESSREYTEGVGAPAIAGFSQLLESKLLSDTADLDNLLDIESASEVTGEGETGRSEQISTEMAALVTQVLPNGNMVINGKQQVRVNFELREIGVSGVIRPEDIDPDNSIHISKIAEARVTYGGKGVVSDVQQPRIGTQIMDIFSPF